MPDVGPGGGRLTPEKAEVIRELFAALTLDLAGERQAAVDKIHATDHEVALNMLFAIAGTFVRRIAQDSDRDPSEVVAEAALSFQRGLDLLPPP